MELQCISYNYVHVRINDNDDRIIIYVYIAAVIVNKLKQTATDDIQLSMILITSCNPCYNYACIL